MTRKFSIVWAASLMLYASLALGEPSVRDLLRQLQGGEDFRVRVQAALSLGKTGDEQVIEPLVKALDDENASVRAAAAAALKNMGNRRAIPALKQHRLDRSEAVRNQVNAAIAALESSEADSDGTPKVLVKLGVMKNGSSVKSSKIETQLASSSRRTLAGLPGIAVVAEEQADADSGSSSNKLPMVMVSGKIQELKASREGTTIIYSASVEYIVHTMPEHSIAAKVSGSAKATASEQEAKDKTRSAELRKAVLEAAIASALRRAPSALMAAAKQ
jgi:hypothetical protein